MGTESIEDRVEVVDSNMTLEEALAGKDDIPQEIRERLRLLTVYYISMDGKLHQGQLVVDEKTEGDLREIFKRLQEMEFPIEKVVPIVRYGWNDDASMEDNNASAFNYRVIAGTDRLSNHSYGRAVDINPLLNPCISSNGNIAPEGAIYDPTKPGTIVDGDEVVQLFLEYGWEWGGHWDTPKDYQHFEKP